MTNAIQKISADIAQFLSWKVGKSDEEVEVVGGRRRRETERLLLIPFAHFLDVGRGWQMTLRSFRFRCD